MNKAILKYFDDDTLYTMARELRDALPDSPIQRFVQLALDDIYEQMDRRQRDRVLMAAGEIIED